jgi:hypothetical protein
MTDLKYLIDRLRTATEGSAALDLAIAVYLGRVEQPDSQLAVICLLRSREAFGIAPWTTSLDAAATLVPLDLEWQVNILRAPHSWPPGAAVCGKPAATPALALCVAALEAIGVITAP